MSKLSDKIKLKNFRVFKRLSQKGLADALGVSTSIIGMMESENQLKYNVSDSIKFKIKQHFDIDFDTEINDDGTLKTSETESKQPQQTRSFIVTYYENPKLNLPHHPKHPDYLMDRSFAESYNPNYKESDFKILCALDDVMDGGALWIRPNDVVLLDVTYDNADKIGMYVYECMDGTYMRAAEINKLMNGDYEFRYSNPKYETKIMKAEELKEVKFRVVGRIVKNLMFFA